MRLQGAPDARRRARRRTRVLQVPGNAADGVPCERIPKMLAPTRGQPRVGARVNGRLQVSVIQLVLLQSMA